MAQVRVDLHCDALTAKPPFGGCVKTEELTAETFQCFAAFTPDDCAADYTAARDLFYSVFNGAGYAAVKNLSELVYARSRGDICGAITCENIGFTGGDPKKIAALKADGVIMASLVWNFPNDLAYPNVRADGKREKRGLKEAGFAALSALDSCGILVDVSHLSDGGLADILRLRQKPVVASHSCAAALKNAQRNLTDLQLKAIADCGGVVGLNFYGAFLGGDGGFSAVAAHLKHIISVAGEDAPAFGSDWDGVPEGGISIYPRDMPRLIQYLSRSGFTQRQLYKICCGNFFRVFGEICG